MSVMIIESCPICGGKMNSIPVCTKITDNYSILDYKFVCEECGFEKQELRPTTTIAKTME